jgi:hypothetical protein
MAKDEYFSFGDEELHGAPDDFFLREESGALALVDPPEDPLAAEEGSLAAEKRAARPRGDSANGSSEKRRPSTRRAHLAVAVALVLVGFLCVWVVVSALGGDARPSSASQPTAKGEVRGGTEAPAGPRVPAVRLSRERAAERQQIRGRRANTRRRARRHREKRKAERRRRAELLREEKSAQEVPAPEYAPPSAPEAAAPSIPEPETSEANATPGSGGLHDGSSSAEFGL